MTVGNFQHKHSTIPSTSIFRVDFGATTGVVNDWEHDVAGYYKTQTLYNSFTTSATAINTVKLMLYTGSNTLTIQRARCYVRVFRVQLRIP
jgi:hypothetical protein